MSLTRSRTEREKRQAHNEANARWRSATAGRPEPRVVDRVLVEAVLHAIKDPKLVPREVRAAVMKAAARGALRGLVRLDYDREQIKVAVSKRFGDALSGQAQSSTVHRAADDVRQTGRVQPFRIRREPSADDPGGIA